MASGTSTKAALERARRTAGAAKADANEMLAMAGTSYMIGSMVKSGNIEKIPEIFGMPRTVTLAIAAKLLAYNAGGAMKQAANGAANAAATVAIFQFAQGLEVAGAAAPSSRGRSLQSERGIAKRLAAKLREQLEEEDVEGDPIDELA